MTKREIAEILQFYLDNGSEEIISEVAQNHFLVRDQLKKSDAKNTIISANNSAKKNIAKPYNSTSEALSALAKKQNNSQNFAAEDLGKFASLNDIIASAKKAAQEAKNLTELRQAIENFEGCNLKKMATKTVFSDGNPNAKIMLIGEAPSNLEDLQGIPFCDDSGKILDEMFKAIHMSRTENFYITNVIFWRPPGNRRPTDEELAICRPFVERHIQLLNPEILVLVGSTAMNSVLGVNDQISNVRGQFFDFAPQFLSRSIKSFVIFHPSYLMRQPTKKKIAWLDMLTLEKFLLTKNNAI